MYIHNLMFVFSSWSKRCDSNLGVLVILPLVHIGYIILDKMGMKQFHLVCT